MLRHLQPAGRLLTCLSGLVSLLLAPGAGAGGWTSAGETDGIPLEWRTTPAGHRAYRGATTVCTSLHGLQHFVADADRFEEWIPFTEAAHAVPSPDETSLYYLRTSAPWPFKSRDMVYRLTAEPVDAAGTIAIRVRGAPDALPERDDAVRMESADGLWILTPLDGSIGVELSLSVDPGRVPGFFANRRVAATVAGILANLTERFPCP